MEIGDLRHLVRIQSPITEKQQDGEEKIIGWRDHAQVWGAIEALNARTIPVGKSYGDLVSHRITMRYLSTVDTNYRVLFGTRAFHIDGIINEDERNIVHYLFCTETTP